MPCQRLWWQSGFSVAWMLLSWVVICEVNHRQLQKVRCFIFNRKIRSAIFHREGCADCGSFVYALFVVAITVLAALIHICPQESVDLFGTEEYLVTEEHQAAFEYLTLVRIVIFLVLIIVGMVFKQMHTLVVVLSWVLFWPVLLLCKQTSCGNETDSENEVSQNQVVPQIQRESHIADSPSQLVPDPEIEDPFAPASFAQRPEQFQSSKLNDEINRLITRMTLEMAE